MIDDLDFSINDPSKITTACYLLSQDAVDGRASSVFSGSEFLRNGYLAWKSLVDECEGRVHLETEAKRLRSLSNNLRLDHRTNGYEHRNHFRGMLKG